MTSENRRASSASVFLIVALKRQSGSFGNPCGAKIFLGRVEKNDFPLLGLKFFVKLLNFLMILKSFIALGEIVI